MKVDIEACEKKMTEVKKICKSVCKKYSVKVYFDDKFKNYGPDRNCAVTGCDYVECAKFDYWNYDLLAISVFHEIGHIEQARRYKEWRDGNVPFEYRDRPNGWVSEYRAWDFAIKLYMDVFKKNISIKISNFILGCLKSYLPDYNPSARYPDQTEKESPFWCPIKKRVIRS